MGPPQANGRGWYGTPAEPDPLSAQGGPGLQRPSAEGPAGRGAAAGGAGPCGPAGIISLVRDGGMNGARPFRRSPCAGPKSNPFKSRPNVLLAVAREQLCPLWPKRLVSPTVRPADAGAT